MAERASFSNGSYQVLARRFRPRSFEEVVGQDDILRSLRSAIASGRVPHAFLFAGSRGVGKTTTARILARALNCERGPTPDPCGECEPCRSILAGSNPDVVEIDAASHNLVDDVRELRERVGFASMGSRYKVYILDEAHMLTRSAFNAFLKTLEEPPPGVVFVLATTELHKVPETIRSRCQVLPFRRIGPADITRRLRAICRHEGVEIDDAVIEDIAFSSRGGMRDAETTLERVLPVAREQPGLGLEDYRRLVGRVGVDRAVEVVGALLAGETAPALHFVDEVAAAGVDEREALGEVLEVLRALLLMRIDGSETDLVALGDDLRGRLAEMAAEADLQRLDAMIQAALVGRERIRLLEDRRIVLEVTLLRIAQAGALSTLGELLASVRAGEVPVQSPAGMAAPSGNRDRGDRAAPVADLRGALLARVRKEKPMLERTLELCRIRGPDENGVVELALQSDKRMHADRLRSPDVREMVQRILRELAGSEVRLEVRAADGPRAEAAGGGDLRPSPSVRRSSPPGPLTRRVLERFDGEVLETDDPDSQ